MTLVIILTGNNISNAGFQHSKNFNASSSLSHPIQVNIRYYNDFSYTSIQGSHIPSGCFVTFKLSLKPPCFLPIVRCQEHLILLRPEKTVKTWLSMQKQQGYMRLDMTEYNLNNIHAYITSVVNKPLADMTAKKKYSKAGKITGLFIRHAINVKQYTFKNKKTGQISYVNATPSHQFYLENKKTFRSISQFSDMDTLLSYNGDTLILLCNGNRHIHCGKPLRYNKLISVYNLEVSLLHTYYVGRQQILVHNTCWPSGTKKHNQIARYQLISDVLYDLISKTGTDVERNGFITETVYSTNKHPQGPLFEYFFSDLDEEPFHLGYNRPDALRFGKYKKLTHAFLYRKVDDFILFLEHAYDLRRGQYLLMSSTTLDMAKRFNLEFLENPAKTFPGKKYEGDHLGSIIEKLFLFNGGRPCNIIRHNCQEFCDYAEGVLTQKSI